MANEGVANEDVANQGMANQGMANQERSDVIDVFVEVPMGSRNKYEYDHETGRFTLDRMLFSAVHFPGDYGFIPETLAEDGDPLDTIVILGEPTFPGCYISSRVVGVMWMRDEKGPDEKILAVPERDPRWIHIQRLKDVPDHLLDEVQHFFSIYKDLEQKQKFTEVKGWSDQEDALQLLDECRRRYRDQHT